MEKNLKRVKEDEESKFEKEHQSYINTKNKLDEYEKILEQLQIDNSYLINKNNEIEQNLHNFEEAYNNTYQQLKQRDEIIEDLERKNSEFTKSIKRTDYERKSSKELLIKILKTKLTTIRSEIDNIRSYYTNELSNLRKENQKIIETLVRKSKQLSNNTEKEIENAIKVTKDKMDKEYKIKVEETQVEMQNEITKVSQKFEKHLLDQLRITEKLEKENKVLTEQQLSLQHRIKEGGYKVLEYEQEIKNLQNQLTRHKADNELLNSSIEKLKEEKKKYKHEYEEQGEISKREAVRKIQTTLHNVLLFITKIKGKYQQEIASLKTDVENLNTIHKSNIYITLDDISINNTRFKNTIDNLETQLYEERKNTKKILHSFEGKEVEYTNIHKDMEKIKEIYENKLQTLNNKIATDENSILELKSQMRTKNDVMKYF